VNEVVTTSDQHPPPGPLGMEATLQEDLGPINLPESMSMEDLVSGTDREYGSTSVHVATSDYFYMTP
jgi:hypothetical protein